MSNAAEDKKSLTDFEIHGLGHELNLADGHAYQELDEEYLDVLDNLGAIWKTSDSISIPKMENRFRDSFATLAKSPAMAALDSFKICPTASNSIDIVSKVLARTGRSVNLIEPTFDNLALLLWRSRVNVAPIREKDFIAAAAQDGFRELLQGKVGDTLFLVNPNNPTGHCLDRDCFSAVADYCATRNILLVLDNSFRFYNRDGFDDYAVLKESGVSFIAFEDTGKVFPTHDLKASLLFYSKDLEPLVTEIYNELYLCDSRFKLAILERLILKTAECGLDRTIWKQVDMRRAFLRKMLANTDIGIDVSAINSQISVEWLDCRGIGMTDIELTGVLAEEGVMILPGRQFFWHSKSDEINHYNIRLALMKPFGVFKEAVEVFCATTLKSNNWRKFYDANFINGARLRSGTL